MLGPYVFMECVERRTEARIAVGWRMLAIEVI